MMQMFRTLTAALVALMFFAAPPAYAQSEFDGVERIVVIGDLEGAYEKYLDMLRTAGLINERGDWIGGRAHLVQLGDIPDRGPNSRAIMDHLMRIEGQARRAGGRVHALIGNHEAMNVEGDLRYVHPGEYAAFATRNSPRLRARHLQNTIDFLRANPPEGGVPTFDDAWRAAWEAQHPLGFVEHRQAWNVEGRYGRWIASHNTVIRINDTLFMHGGLGPSFVAPDRNTMNRAVQGALNGEPLAGFENILVNQEGPLWYRGLARNEEATEAPHLDAVLQRHGVRRIVVGHTKLAPAIIPRFGGRVIVADVANVANHPDPHAFVIIEGDVVTAVHRGQRVPLTAATPEQRCGYLAAVAALDPAGGPIARLAEACTQAQQPALTPEPVE